MYRSILVALDGSRWSEAALEMGLALGHRFKSRLAGMHVYAARMHRVRFQQMEPGLPEKYQAEKELEGKVNRSNG